MADEFVVAKMLVEPTPLDVWAALAQAMADALDRLGYDTYYRGGGEVVARRRDHDTGATSRDVAPEIEEADR